jgi:DUF971 family protein
MKHKTNYLISIEINDINSDDIFNNKYLEKLTKKNENAFKSREFCNQAVSQSVSQVRLDDFLKNNDIT